MAAPKDHRLPFPQKGLSHEDVLDRMRSLKSQDADWRGARTWSLLYPAGEDVDDLLHDANNLYLYENALNPFRFPRDVGGSISKLKPSAQTNFGSFIQPCIES